MNHSQETKECPGCNKKMIKRYQNRVLTSYPPQYPWDWWCGGCGLVGEGGIDEGMTQEEMYQKEWENANA